MKKTISEYKAIVKCDYPGCKENYITNDQSYNMNHFSTLHHCFEFGLPTCRTYHFCQKHFNEIVNLDIINGITR